MKITFTTFVAGCSLLLLSLTITPVTVRADQDMEAMDFEVSSGDDMMDDAEATNEVFLLLSEKVGMYLFIQCPVPLRCPPISSLCLVICLFLSLKLCCLPSLPLIPRSFKPTTICLFLPKSHPAFLHLLLLIASDPTHTQQSCLDFRRGHHPFP